MTQIIDNLREVRASIASLDRPFYMDGWDFCICGHARRVFKTSVHTEKIAEFLGFGQEVFFSRWDRNEALAFLDSEIARREAEYLLETRIPEPEPELVGV